VTPETARVIIVDPEELFRKEVRAVLKNTSSYLIQDSPLVDTSIASLFEAHIPSVLIVGPNAPTESVFEVVADLALQKPFVSVLLVSRELDTELLRQALRAGIKDVLQIPLKRDTLIASVDNAARFSSSVLGAMESTREQKPAGRGAGKVITVFSTKGGVGKTVVATNLAVSLAKGGLKTVIVDLDLKFGDVAVMLKLTPEHSVYEVVQAGDRLDEELLEGILARHADTGLKALLAPLDPELADSIREKQIIDVIEFLRRFFDVVVVDTPASIDKMILGVVDASDEVLLVATMDVPSVKNAKIAHGMLKMLNVPSSHIKLVLNRADSKVGLGIGDVEKSIGARVFQTIPSDRLVPRSVNLGIPVVLSSPRSEVARSIESLAGHLVAEHNAVHR